MNGDLKKIVKTLVAPMVEFQEKIKVDIVEENDVIQCKIYSAASDVGRLIGRNGSIAENIQQVVRAFGRLGLKKVQISVTSCDA